MKTPFPLSGRLVLTTGAFAFASMWACTATDSSGQSASAGVTLAEGCSINTDCDSPLVCAFKRCHNACTTTRDCPAGERCMASDRPFHVCQLPVESKCTYNTDCPERQLCGVDGQCRDQCASDRDCVAGQVCTSGACAEETELSNGALPVVDAGISMVGQACSYNSQCPAPLTCRSGLCETECLASTDCAAGYTCIAGRCAPLAGGAVTAEIGPEGGTVTSGDGTLTMTIPPGAVAQSLVLAIRKADAWPAGAVGTVLEIEPTGTQFQTPITLSFSYASFTPGAIAPASLAVATAVGPSWQSLGAATIDTAAETISATTTHLSIYGLIVTGGSVMAGSGGGATFEAGAGGGATGGFAGVGGIAGTAGTGVGGAPAGFGGSVAAGGTGAGGGTAGTGAGGAVAGIGGSGTGGAIAGMGGAPADAAAD